LTYATCSRAATGCPTRFILRHVPSGAGQPHPP
jgi:hypothetical protein